MKLIIETIISSIKTAMEVLNIRYYRKKGENPISIANGKSFEEIIKVVKKLCIYI